VRLDWSARHRLREYVRGSLWVLPLVGGIIGALLAILSGHLDATVQVPASWQYTSNTATTMLSTIAGAMIGLLGLVVTIGVLVVQQATSALSPRFMRLWYAQRLQKVVLATFASTFTFAFANLRLISNDFVPDIGVTVAGLACGVSLVMLLVYLDSFTHHLRPVAVAALVARSGERVVVRTTQMLSSGVASRPLTDATPEPVLCVRADRAGAIQAIHAEGLLALGVQHNCTLVFIAGVGDFVSPGTTLVEVYGTTAPSADAVLRCVAFGVERTIEQDPGFALRILVDIAIRALSPAVNDPTTAVQVLNHIEMLLHAVAGSPLPGRYSLDDADGRQRVVIPGRQWEQYLELALTEIRQYGGTSTQVGRRLKALLEYLFDNVAADRRPAVEQQLAQLDATIGRGFPDPSEHALASDSDRQGIGGRKDKP
jgi:uncharacterized membrane protein